MRGAPRSPSEAGVAFGGVSRDATREVDTKYRDAIASGHTVELLLHCPFGGLEDRAAARLQLLHNTFKGQLADPEHAPWTARSFLVPPDARTAYQHRRAAVEAARQICAAIRGRWSADAPHAARAV